MFIYRKKMDKIIKKLILIMNVNLFLILQILIIFYIIYIKKNISILPANIDIILEI